MSEDVAVPGGQELRALCQEAIALIQNLPGPVRRVVVRSAEQLVEVEWSMGEGAPVPTVTAPPPAPGAGALALVPDETPAAPRDAGAHVVRAPLVGTFYRRPQPDADPFVSVGDVVEAGQTVAIVEAMKLLNPIVTEVAGRVVEICVPDGEPVEFDQPLIHIQPLVDSTAE
jgi:acetyl-CoA carboxylase biotin carboxyl carrier protein